MDRLPSESREQYIRRLFNDMSYRWSGFHSAQTAELNFSLRLDHWQDFDNSDDAVRGQELFNLIRHKAGRIAQAGIHVEARPVDDEAQKADLAEVAQAAIEWEIFNPAKGFEDVLDRAIIGALAGRMWAGSAWFNPGIGPYGEITFQLNDGRNVMWTDGFLGPHDQECPEVMLTFRMRIGDAKRKKGWKNTDQLRPDSGYQYGSSPGTSTTISGAVALGGTSATSPTLEPSNEDEYFTGICLWERNAGETRKQEADYRELKPAERYMVCQDCGYRSQAFGDMTKQEKSQLPGGQMPEMAPGMCPECGDALHRIDAVATEVTNKVYPKGRYTIAAPLSGVIMLESGWPHGVRTPPIFVLTAYDDPVEPMGLSETTLNRTMQCASNMTLRLGIEHMVLAKPYMSIPTTTVDAQGRPWDGSSDQGLWMFYDPSQGPGGASVVQAAGLPPAWSTLHQAIQNVFKANMGSSDISLTPEQSRDIPVGTIDALIKTGEVPLDHFIIRMGRSLSPFMGSLFDMIRSTYQPERWIRMEGQDGVRRMMLIHGADLPNYDIIVTSAPTLQKMAREDVQAWKEFVASPPEARAFMARRLNLPISEVRKLEADEKAMLEQQQTFSALQARRQPAANGTAGMAVQGGMQ